MNHRNHIVTHLLLGAVLLISIAVSVGWPFSKLPLPIDLYIILVAVGFMAYFGIAWLIIKQPVLPRSLFFGLLCVAVLIRLIALDGTHRTNSDLWRYAWDGHVFSQGYNPLAYTPDAPELDEIREQFPYHKLNPGYNNIPTVYGPTASICFALASVLPFPTDDLIRLFVTVGDLLAILFLIQMLEFCGLAPALVLIYALNPLVIDSLPQRGQVESLMMPLLLFSCLSLIQKRYVLAGIALALSGGVKIIALIAVIPMIFYLWRRSNNSLLRFTIGLVSMALLVSIPYVMAESISLEGFRTMASNWRGNESLFGILKVIAGQTIAQAVAGIILLCCIAWQTTRTDPNKRDLLNHIGIILFVVVLLSPVVFPWYLMWALPFVLFGLAEKPPRPWSLACLILSGTVMLWYLRFLVYPPMDTPHWPLIQNLLTQTSNTIREPWRLLEYGLPALLFAYTLIHQRKINRGTGKQSS